MMADSNLNGDANLVDDPSWERAHQMLVGLARRRAGLDLDEGKWLLAASRGRVDRRRGSTPPAGAPFETWNEWFQAAFAGVCRPIRPTIAYGDMCCASRYRAKF